MRKVLLGLALAVLAGLAGCANPSTNPSTAPRTTIRATTTTARLRPSALDQLAGFIQAAENMDAQLTDAATHINGSGPPWTQPWPTDVVSAVEAADLGRVAATLPAGLPKDLLAPAILVYSDLASRRYAMRWFGAEGFPYVEPASQMDNELTNALANGAPAAARFASDLAGLTRLARTTSPISLAAPSSREAADVLLLVEWVDGMNGGCGSTGGAVVTALPDISWIAHGDASGTIAGIDFKAELIGGRWRVTLFAC